MFADDDSPPQERSSFSADLKLFVGNLSFDVDSAQLAQLFESAGTVEMVEVRTDSLPKSLVLYSFSDEVEIPH